MYKHSEILYELAFWGRRKGRKGVRLGSVIATEADTFRTTPSPKKTSKVWHERRVRPAAAFPAEGSASDRQETIAAARRMSRFIIDRKPRQNNNRTNKSSLFIRLIISYLSLIQTLSIPPRWRLRTFIDYHFVTKAYLLSNAVFRKINCRLLSTNAIPRSLVDYKAEFSNLEFRLGMMRIQRFIDLYLSKMVRGVDSILQLSRWINHQESAASPLHPN